MTSLAALLLLADGRLPAGGHAHSGGLEAAVTAGRLRDLDELAGFLHGRLATAGRVAAAFAACACAAGAAAAGALERLGALDGGLDARTPAPALRRASRAQGRALLRAGQAIYPSGGTAPFDLARIVAALPGARQRVGPHHPVALGLLAARAGLSPAQAAVAAAHGTVTAPAGAAVRLLALDPYAVHALLAGLTGEIDRIAAGAATRLDAPVDELPADSAPLLDIGAEHHATWEVRLFAS